MKLVLHARHVVNDVTYHASFRCHLAKGTYYFRVYATDPAGNRGAVATDDLFVR